MICAFISLCFWLLLASAEIGITLLLGFCSLLLSIVSGIIELFISIISGGVPIMVADKPAEKTKMEQNRWHQKAINKEIKKEISRAQDDLEYDMLMMMEVCADD